LHLMQCWILPVVPTGRHETLVFDSERPLQGVPRNVVLLHQACARTGLAR
jgi:hypothetical protein